MGEQAMSKPRLTSHQREVLARLRKRSETSGRVGQGGWVRADVIGSAGACAHLVDKGYVERKEESGPRGGEHHYYRPIER